MNVLTAEAMDLDLTRLAREVSEKLVKYEVPPRSGREVGYPLPDDWFASRLAAMNAALVAPYWTNMRDGDPKTDMLVVRHVVVVADEHGSLVAFDPSGEGTFVLALRDSDPDRDRGVDVVSCGVRGEAVDCFLSA